MRFSRLFLAVLCLPALAAAPAFATAVAPTPDTTPLSQPRVTPDASFTDSGYMYKWPHITLKETRRLMKKHGTVLVDGRSLLEWQQGHLPGALPLPLGDFEASYKTYEHKLKRAKIIIAYCHGKGCHLSDSLCQDLVNKGFHNVAVFWGGYPEWSAAKLPLVDKYNRPVAHVGGPAQAAH